MVFLVLLPADGSAMTALLFLLTCRRHRHDAYHAKKETTDESTQRKVGGHTVLSCPIGRMPCYNKDRYRVSLVYAFSRVWKSSQNQGRRVTIDKGEDSGLTA